MFRHRVSIVTHFDVGINFDITGRRSTLILCLLSWVSNLHGVKFILSAKSYSGNFQVNFFLPNFGGNIINLVFKYINYPEM